MTKYSRRLFAAAIIILVWASYAYATISDSEIGTALGVGYMVFALGSFALYRLFLDRR